VSMEATLPVIGKPGRPEFAALLDYWNELRGGREMPSAREFDVLHLPRLIGRLNVVEVHHRPLRYRFRVHGTSIAEAIGRDYTGRWIHLVESPAWVSGAIRHFDEVVAARKPRYSHTEAQAEFGYVVMRRLICPFAGDDLEIDRLIMVVLVDRRVGNNDPGRG